MGPLAYAGITAGVKGLGAIAKWFGDRKNRIPAFETTPLGKALMLYSKQGRISPTAQSNILNAQTREAGNVASRQIADIRGALASRNMLGSIAGTKLMTDPLTGVRDTVAGATERLQTENELSKVDAALRLAEGKNQSILQRAYQDRQDWSNLVGGLTGAVGSGVDAYQAYQGQGMEDVVNQVGLLILSGRYDEANEILNKILKRQ